MEIPKTRKIVCTTRQRTDNQMPRLSAHSTSNSHIWFILLYVLVFLLEPSESVFHVSSSVFLLRRLDTRPPQHTPTAGFHILYTSHLFPCCMVWPIMLTTSQCHKRYKYTNARPTAHAAGCCRTRPSPIGVVVVFGLAPYNLEMPENYSFIFTVITIVILFYSFFLILIFGNFLLIWPSSIEMERAPLLACVAHYTLRNSVSPGIYMVAFEPPCTDLLSAETRRDHGCHSN